MESKYLWNVGKLLPDYTAQHSSRQTSSFSPAWQQETSIIYYFLSPRNETDQRDIQVSATKHYTRYFKFASCLCFPHFIASSVTSLKNTHSRYSSFRCCGSHSTQSPRRWCIAPLPAASWQGLHFTGSFSRYYKFKALADNQSIHCQPSALKTLAQH
jgi:hypothetical protein